MANVLVCLFDRRRFENTDLLIRRTFDERVNSFRMLTNDFYQTDILKDVPFEETDDIQKTAKNIADALYQNEALELESYDVIAWDSDNGLVFVMMKSYGMISSVISWMSLDCIQPQELIFGYTKTGGVEKLIVKNSFPYRHSVERHC